jgi:hypothetical protein
MCPEDRVARQLYYVDQRSIDDVVDEVRTLKDSGWRSVKIMLKATIPPSTAITHL